MCSDRHIDHQELSCRTQDHRFRNEPPSGKTRISTKISFLWAPFYKNWLKTGLSTRNSISEFLLKLDRIKVFLLLMRKLFPTNQYKVECASEGVFSKESQLFKKSEKYCEVGLYHVSFTHQFSPFCILWFIRITSSPSFRLVIAKLGRR